MSTRPRDGPERAFRGHERRLADRRMLLAGAFLPCPPISRTIWKRGITIRDPHHISIGYLNTASTPLIESERLGRATEERPQGDGWV